MEINFQKLPDGRIPVPVGVKERLLTLTLHLAAIHPCLGLLPKLISVIVLILDYHLFYNDDGGKPYYVQRDVPCKGVTHEYHV